jgi:hypothetical protein
MFLNELGPIDTTNKNRNHGRNHHA